MSDLRGQTQVHKCPGEQRTHVAQLLLLPQRRQVLLIRVEVFVDIGRGRNAEALAQGRRSGTLKLTTRVAGARSGKERRWKKR
jgi:hypothetical protein